MRAMALLFSISSLLGASSLVKYSFATSFPVMASMNSLTLLMRVWIVCPMVCRSAATVFRSVSTI